MKTDFPPLSVIFHYRKVGKYAINVLAGALETDELTRELPTHFVREPEGIVDAAREALAAGHRALVVWSFYSPSFAENVTDLARTRELLDAGRYGDRRSDKDAGRYGDRRSDDAKVLHIAGGVHASAEPEQTLRAGFDMVGCGEGESTIVQLCRALAMGDDWRGIPGMAWLDGNAQMRKNGTGPFVDLNDYPPFSAKHMKFGPIEITRGCVFACSFCQTPFISKARFRHRTVDNVCEHTRRMVSHNFRDYRFITPTSMSYGAVGGETNLAAVEELLRRVREIIGPDRHLYYGTFPSEIRPEHVTPECLALLKKYVDNDNIIIGGQSGSQRVLDAIHRGHDVESIRRAVHIALENGFTPNVDFLFGLPEEEPEDGEVTRAFAEELAALGARIHSHTFMPLPGTPMRNAPAGTVDNTTARLLLSLESEGRAYGKWKDQQDTAAQLAAMRSDLVAQASRL